MDTLVTVTIAAAWTAIFGMLFWGIARSWRAVMRDHGPLPVFGMLERRGLPREVAERMPDGLYAAVRRCAMCRERERCGEWLAGRADGPAPECPNADFMDRAARA